MDDVTIITITKPCTRRLLQKLQENIQWARMELKSSKSHSISVVKGQLTGERFYISNEPIPTVLEKSIKSLGRWFNADIRDTQQLEQLWQDTANGLRQINNKEHPGKLLVFPARVATQTSVAVDHVRGLANPCQSTGKANELSCEDISWSSKMSQ